MRISVFNYNTLEKVHTFEAHTDYIRCLAVHPTQVCAGALRKYCAHALQTLCHGLFCPVMSAIALSLMICGQPYLLSSSDDMSIKMWDWNQDWALKQTFEGTVTTGDIS
jgi:coatomer subunit beta'